MHKLGVLGLCIFFSSGGHFSPLVQSKSLALRFEIEKGTSISAFFYVRTLAFTAKYLPCSVIKNHMQYEYRLSLIREAS